MTGEEGQDRTKRAGQDRKGSTGQRGQGQGKAKNRTRKGERTLQNR